MSCDKKIIKIIDWLNQAGLHKEASDLADLLAGSDDAELSSKIRKLKIERARMIALSGAFRGNNIHSNPGKNFSIRYN